MHQNQIALSTRLGLYGHLKEALLEGLAHLHWWEIRFSRWMVSTVADFLSKPNYPILSIFSILSAATQSICVLWELSEAGKYLKTVNPEIQQPQHSVTNLTQQGGS